MRFKAIPADDAHQRELLQKTRIGSLNRANDTIERVETAGVVSCAAGTGEVRLSFR
jgi:hypothetical protein